MPRILLLITDLEIGGTPTVVRELAIRLSQGAEAAKDVHVACLSPWGPVADQIASAGIAVTALNARSLTDWRVIPRLCRLIRQERIDTVFSFLVHANAVAATASLFCRDVRYLQSIQTTQPEPRWHWRLGRLIHPAAKKIIVPSPSVAAVAARWSHIPPDKIAIIPNAVDLDAFRGLAAPPAGTVPFPIGFIGRLDPIKRIPDLLEAVSGMARASCPCAVSATGETPVPPVHLHIFGEGPQRSLIEQRIAEMGVQSRVTLHGAVARPQEALAQIGLLVLPSEAEGFGLVLIEAMAAGIPIVATDVPGIRDVVRHDVTGLLVPPASPRRLAAAISRLIDDSALRQRLTHSAFQDVVQRFAWDAVMRQYRQLLLLPIK